MAERAITPSQTVGPYFHYALTPGDAYRFPALIGNDLVTADAVGQPIVIRGSVVDGDGVAIRDALVEIWQADGNGRYAAHAGSNTAFRGFGRAATDAAGVYRFRTVKPGAVVAADGRPQAPHLDVGVFARGVNRRLFTRLYFDGEAANAADPVLALVPAGRRPTLLARREGSQEGLPRYVFDIRLQGGDETVFFEA